MTRYQIQITSERKREEALRVVRAAPQFSRVEIKSQKRTLPQNSLLWLRLTEISLKVEWYGHKLSPDDWKDVFTASLRRARVVPGLDHGSFVPLGMRTSDLSKEEMSDLFELMSAFAAERGVELTA